jgi:hypothetical protein
VLLDMRLGKTHAFQKNSLVPRDFVGFLTDWIRNFVSQPALAPTA